MDARRREELAWAAGLVDGDGSWQDSTRGRSPYLVVTQNRADMPQEIVRLMALFPMSRLDGPYYVKGRLPNWRWVLQGFEKFQYAVAQLWPWMSAEKRQQAYSLAMKYHAAGRQLTRKPPAPYVYHCHREEHE